MNIFKTTALYGKSFAPSEEADVYTLSVYTGGFAGVKTATERVEKEAQDFLKSSRYSDFRISEARRVWVPFSRVDFRVAFSPNQNEEAEQVSGGNGGQRC